MVNRTPQPAEVQEHLQQILQSKPFLSSKRLREFLTFVVTRELEGRGDELKEYTIATEVYGRSAEYDPQVDSTVRVEASRLRAKLRDYYGLETAAGPVRIELPKGTYVPVFVSTAEAPEPVPVDAPEVPAYRRTTIGFAATVLLAIVGAVAYSRMDRNLPTVSAAAPLNDSKLLDQYLRADELLRKQVLLDGWPGSVPPNVAESIALFEDLTRKAPRYAKGWVGLAEAQEWAYELDKNHPRARIDAARAAAEKAVALDSHLADAHSRLAAIYLFSYGDVEKAHGANERALELNPRDARAQARRVDLLRMRGDLEGALSATANGLAAEPSSARLWAQKGLVLYDMARYAEAIGAATHALQLNSGNNLNQAAIAHWVRGLAYQQQGIGDRAEAEFRTALSISPQDERNYPALGHLLAQQGRVEQARAVLNSLLEQQSQGRQVRFGIALVYAGLGDHQQAREWLKRAGADGETSYLFRSLDKRLAPIAGVVQTAAL